MKQETEWFIDKIRIAKEFGVFVIIADTDITTIPITRSIAIDLVQAGANYGFYTGDCLIIGKTPTDFDCESGTHLMSLMSEDEEETTTPPPPPVAKASDKKSNILPVVVPYKSAADSIKIHIESGWELSTSLQTPNNPDDVTLIFKR